MKENGITKIRHARHPHKNYHRSCSCKSIGTPHSFYLYNSCYTHDLSCKLWPMTTLNPGIQTIATVMQNLYVYYTLYNWSPKESFKQSI